MRRGRTQVSLGKLHKFLLVKANLMAGLTKIRGREFF